ncbi:MAG: M12 family metallo-peptidase [Akkermansiaceae bacterium]|jgi:hypothetical protein|nr:M12 family metallo-peptidase [Akkermansiaceae bacterium]
MKSIRLPYLCPVMFRSLVFIMAGFTLPAGAEPSPRQFPAGQLQKIDQLPASRLRSQLQQLPVEARERAQNRLRGIHFTEGDLPSMHADREGGICYACKFHGAHPAEPAPAVELELQEPRISKAAVPVSPFPASLIFHSRPGAPNVLYINFSGENVTGTAWNTEISRTSIPTVAFSTDADLANFSDAEQIVIKRIWQRMAEDFAPFNIDVTTERPATFNNRTSMALITRRTDANGALNPFSSAGGVAYVDVFGISNFATYRPAFVYHDNLGNSESLIAEAASHEIGHNLGLSHDGTSSLEYYGGHGTGDTSWGPIMGTGYNRNVSQWSKGEYHLADNTQDDLATIASKIGYRTDDHGGTSGTATSLVLTNNTTVTSTTPETDPANASPANKGVISSLTDVDVFAFTSGAGSASLTVNPWITSGGTRGGNLDVRLELYNQAGTLITSANPAGQTHASIVATLSEGRYFLHVKNSNQGTPLANPPSGYTAYASIGQYFISGSIPDGSGVVIPPVAELQVSNLTTTRNATHTFTVTYSDNSAISVASIDSNDILVTGPGSYSQLAQRVSININTNGSPRTATYSITPPGGTTWASNHNGTYTIAMRASQVVDTEGAFVPAATLGQFQVNLPFSVYFSGLENSTGWTFDPAWAFGTPNLASQSGPNSGFTGTNAIAYNLTGNYAASLSPKYATSPVMNSTGASSLVLRFRRWLRIRASDTASIEVSSNGTSWTSVWSTTQGISDTGWQDIQYQIPASVVGSSTLKVRWGISSNTDGQTDIGWNMDDIELLAGAFTDTAAPTASVKVAPVTAAGSPSQSCTVVYTDATAVKLSTLDSNDLTVTGPGGYSTPVVFVGTSTTADGTPITGIYSIPAKGGSWDHTDNGTYTVTLKAGAISDTSNNINPVTTLGAFSVSVSPPTPGLLAVTPEGGLTATGPPGGTIVPASRAYTLTNTGQTQLTWSAEATVSWIGLSASGGTLPPGATTVVTAAFNSVASSLEGGGYSGTIHFNNVTNSGGNTSRSLSLTLVNPGTLGINPAGNVEISGLQGGPFIPQTLSYTVSNAGETPLVWAVASNVPWIELNPQGGTLAPGASTTVTASFTSAVNGLAGGSYTGSIQFTNSTSGLGSDTRNIQLSVIGASALSVGPGQNFAASGPAGGPFAPASTTYTLTNSGGMAMSWAATASLPWIAVNPPSGILAPAESTQVTVSFNQAANGLSANTYQGSVDFINSDNGVGNASRNVTLQVTQPLRFTASGKTSGGLFQMTLQGFPGTAVVLEATDNLSSWLPIANGQIGLDGTLILSDPESLTRPSRFYRATPAP